MTRAKENSVACICDVIFLKCDRMFVNNKDITALISRDVGNNNKKK